MPLPDPPPLGRLPFEPPIQASPELAHFWQLWREEKFWACHEALEDIWKHEPDIGRKRFLQGLIHGAVTVFQFRRGNFVGASRQLARARARLGASIATGQSVREGVEIESFLDGIAREIAPAVESLSDKDRADVQALEARLSLSLAPDSAAPDSAASATHEEPERAPGA